MAEYVIRAIGFANGAPCPFAEQWLKSFDHEARDGQGHGVFTPDVAEAIVFCTPGDAIDFWQRISLNRPLRPDAKPNRPMTALTVSIDPLE